MDKNVRNRYTVGVLVSNEPGVLSRVSGLFSRRGFNIESLAVGPTQDQTISRITIVVLGNDSSIEQLVQQLYKLICVCKVRVYDPANTVERQLVMIKVAANASDREGLMRLVEIFKAKVVDVTRESLTLTITGDVEKVSAMVELMQDFGITEIVRTGTVALQRGNQIMNSEIFDL